MDTPIGPFTMVVTDNGSVLASGFTHDLDALLSLVHPSLRVEARSRSDLGPATKAVTGYFEGQCTALDGVPVQQRCDGTFLGQVWETMRGVRPGEPVSYRTLAELAGRPSAIRAAAQACARNAAALFVPCHRVLRGDGSLGGYRWGTPTKRWLLDYENAAAG